MEIPCAVASRGDVMRSGWPSSQSSPSSALDAGENSHQRGFARSVFADEHVDAVAVHAKCYMVERMFPGYRLTMFRASRITSGGEWLLCDTCVNVCCTRSSIPRGAVCAPFRACADEFFPPRGRVLARFGKGLPPA